VIAPIDKRAFKMVEQLRQLRPRNRHSRFLFGTSASFAFST
jgi:hypothetical protein